MNSNSTRIIQAIQETQRFIDLEEKRSADLRPAAVAELLAKYKAHLAKLQGMLEAA